MIKLPSSLERKLTEMFPRIRERERFVAEILEEALAKKHPNMEGLPVTIGGTLHLFTDGGSRGNPGKAAIGGILEDPSTGIVLEELSQAIGIATNNVAEYRALIEGLKLARRHQPSRLMCHLDSELIVKQLNGEYRVKMPSLQQYVDEIQALCKELPDVVFAYVPREDNWRADALVNKALDAEERGQKGQGRLPWGG